MTRRATRHHFLAPDLIIGFKFLAFRLIYIAVLPIHLKHLIFWPNKGFRRSMARNAPFHLKRIFLENSRHLIDLPMASGTSNTLRNMNAVIKIRVAGQFVYAFPLDRLVITITSPNWLKIGAVSPNLAVTVHTRLSRRHSRGRGRFYCLVAVPTIDSIVPYVMLMAKLNRLLHFEIAAGKIRRAGYLCVCKKSGSAQYYSRDHADFGNIICTLIENLCHFLNI